MCGAGSAHVPPWLSLPQALPCLWEEECQAGAGGTERDIAGPPVSSQGTEGPCGRFSRVYLRHYSCSSVVQIGCASTFLPEYGFKPHLVPCRDPQDGEGAQHTSFSPDTSLHQVRFPPGPWPRAPGVAWEPGHAEQHHQGQVGLVGVLGVWGAQLPSHLLLLQALR